MNALITGDVLICGQYQACGIATVRPRL